VCTEHTAGAVVSQCPQSFRQGIREQRGCILLGDPASSGGEVGAARSGWVAFFGERVVGDF